MKPQEMMESSWKDSVGELDENADNETAILNHEGKWNFGEVLSAPQLGQEVLATVHLATVCTVCLKKSLL